MCEFGRNGWESEVKDELPTIRVEDIFGVSSTEIDQLLFGDVNYQQPYNLQYQPLPQQTFFQYRATPLNGYVTHVDSGLAQLPNNLHGGSAAPRRQRKPRKTWSLQEHRLFLVAFEKYGVSWKKISQDVLPTKTPSQLASHAQKYFKRQNMPLSQRKRRSIHDITL